jgi:hypothetical protein
LQFVFALRKVSTLHLAFAIASISKGSPLEISKRLSVQGALLHFFRASKTILYEYCLSDDSMATPEPPTSPIPANEDSVEIDPTQPSKSLAKRSIDITEIECSFKRGVTSALQQRHLFVLERGDITAADVAAFQLQAISPSQTSWSDE